MDATSGGPEGTAGPGTGLSTAGTETGMSTAGTGVSTVTRASDRERDAVLQRVQQAFAEGRLDDAEDRSHR